jgi:hypothetical protein
VQRDAATVSNAAVVLAVAAFTLAGFFVFPGHTWLGSDTQIYIPFLERFYDPSVLSRELIATRPHLGWTAYDEIALALRRATSLPFHHVLFAEQLVFRALAVWGVYLIAASMGLRRRFALMAAGLYALGATIPGPAVMSIEFEPVPRGFALSLVVLAIGLTCRGRAQWAAVAGSAALLFHAPTTLPFWLVFAWLAWRRREWPLLAAPAVAAALLILLWLIQPGGNPVQPVFRRIDSAWEEILRLRASYAWVSTWPRRLLWQYSLLWLMSIGAVLRLWRSLDENHRAFWLGLPLAGALSVPLSALLLEGMKWSIVPQLQPARHVLLLTLCAVLLAAIAAITAACRGKLLEAFAWMLPVFAVPVHADLLMPFRWSQLAIIAGLAAASVAAVRLGMSSRPWAPLPCTAVVLAAMFAIPNLGGVHNYPDLQSRDLDALCAWGDSTPKDALFLFPDAGRSLIPGIFRATARRALYVDWKAGGQANFFEDLGLEWRRRWLAVMTGPVDPARLRTLGIDYVVVSPKHPISGLSPVFQNRQFAAYRLP